ncbi:MAG: hypothetical protein QOC92_2168 [Acidimicrobiaceae bacterium]|jgi:RimJ/RimL family protein N-acetyltransferase
MTTHHPIDAVPVVGCEVLDESECLRLLSLEPVGRLALTASALPVVLPINFTLSGRRIVFATETGLKLDAARARTVACLEVDGFDRFAHSGWSVLATGRLAEITDPHRLTEAEHLPLSPWAAPHANHYVELGVELLSGRRITRTATAVIARLRDDTKIQIQPIAPSDGDRLIRFHETLSAETTRTRFFALHPHLSNQEVSVFTHVDHQDREAFVALLDNEIIGVARFDRLPNSARAEVAFVIADRWQGLGLATLLFHHLAERAAGVGIRHFVAETLAENRRMLALFEHTGMVTHRSTDHGVVDLEMDISPNHNPKR